MDADLTRESRRALSPVGITIRGRRQIECGRWEGRSGAGKRECGEYEGATRREWHGKTCWPRRGRVISARRGAARSGGVAANGFVFWMACRYPARGRNGEREKEIQLWDSGIREGRKGVERRVVIFIKNVPRGSDASYEIVALTAAKLRLSRPKSRPQTGAY